MKWPGTYAAYAAIMAVFGQTTEGIHLGVLFVNLASTALVFSIGRRMAGAMGGAAAAAVHAIVTIEVPMMGLAGHATHFVAICALGGFALLIGNKPAGVRRVFVAGILFGLATLMKQNGAAFGAFAAVWLVRQDLGPGRRDVPRTLKRVIAIAAGGLLPLAMTGVWLWQAGVWAKFWFWTVLYARSYVSILSVGESLRTSSSPCRPSQRRRLVSGPWRSSARWCFSDGRP